MSFSHGKLTLDSEVSESIERDRLTQCLRNGPIGPFWDSSLRKRKSTVGVDVPFHLLREEWPILSKKTDVIDNTCSIPTSMFYFTFYPTSQLVHSRIIAYLFSKLALHRCALQNKQNNRLPGRRIHNVILYPLLSVSDNLARTQFVYYL